MKMDNEPISEEQKYEWIIQKTIAVKRILKIKMMLIFIKL